jgi:hypothetical protein
MQIVVTFVKGKPMFQIKKDGNHKPNIKIQQPITQRLNNIRLQTTLHPQKGTKNPPHWHVKIPSIKSVSLPLDFLQIKRDNDLNNLTR